MGGKRYSQSLKERAFRIFYESGSIGEVVRILKIENKAISKSTVAAWAKEPDARGKDWYTRREEIQAVSHERVDEQISNDRQQILKDAAKFKQRLVDALPVVEAKTAEGATFAFTAISKFILEQSGADRNSEQTAKQAVSALILALKDDAEIAFIIERKWPEIEERFFKHLERIQKADKK